MYFARGSSGSQKMQGVVSVLQSCWLLCCLPLLAVRVEATCTWTDRPNTLAAVGQAVQAGVSTLADCKSTCGEGCCFVGFNAGTSECKHFSTTPGYIEENNFYPDSYHIKNNNCCAAEETTTATTGCTMNAASASISSEPTVSVDVDASVDSCRKLCKLLSQCQAISYGSSTCNIYTSSTSSGVASNTVFAKKTHCSSGGKCCFSDLEDSKTGSGTSVSVTASEQSCKDMCLEITSCMAASFSGSTCNIFFSAPSTESGSSTYYTKTCTGLSTGSLTGTDACGSAEVTKLSKLLGGIWLIMICTALL